MDFPKHEKSRKEFHVAKNLAILVNFLWGKKIRDEIRFKIHV